MGSLDVNGVFSGTHIRPFDIRSVRGSYYPVHTSYQGQYVGSKRMFTYLYPPTFTRAKHVAVPRGVRSSKSAIGKKAVPKKTSISKKGQYAVSHKNVFDVITYDDAEKNKWRDPRKADNTGQIIVQKPFKERVYLDVYIALPVSGMGKFLSRI